MTQTWKLSEVVEWLLNRFQVFIPGNPLYMALELGSAASWNYSQPRDGED